MGFLSKLFGGASTTSEPPVIIAGKKRGRPDFEIAGESKYQRALTAICGPKCEEGYRVEGMAVLIPEPTNQYDPNAVRVEIEGRTVGYLFREDALWFNRSMASEGYAGRSATCGSIIVGGWDRGDGDTGHFGVKLNIVRPLAVLE